MPSHCFAPVPMALKATTRFPPAADCPATVTNTWVAVASTRRSGAPTAGFQAVTAPLVAETEATFLRVTPPTVEKLPAR